MMITAAVAKVISKSVYRCNDVKSATRSSRLAIGLSMDDWVGAVCTVLNIVLKTGTGEIDTSVLNILDISNQPILPCGIQSCEADTKYFCGFFSADKFFHRWDTCCLNLIRNRSHMSALVNCFTSAWYLASIYCTVCLNRINIHSMTGTVS